MKYNVFHFLGGERCTFFYGRAAFGELKEVDFPLSFPSGLNKSQSHMPPKREISEDGIKIDYCWNK
jgi:hypothetical protein